MNFYPTTVAQLISDINTANGNGQTDTIYLKAGYTYLLTAINNTTDGNNGLPSITSNITIVGNGAIIARDTSSANKFRLFHVASSGNLTLKGLVLRDGEMTNLNDGGVAVLNRGSLTINECTLMNNKTTNQGYGGAILNWSGATLSITNTTITQNSAFNSAGIWSQGTLTISSSVISRNTGNAGGGVWIAGGSATITSSILSENFANDGGALRCNNGSLTVTNCDLLGNIATNSGGCLYVYKSVGSDNPIATLNNNRIVGNITGNPSTGSVHKSFSPQMNAENNWWGAANGPALAGGGGGSGDSVNSNVDYTPYLTTDTCEHPGASGCTVGAGGLVWGSNDAVNSSNPISLRLGEKRLDETDFLVDSPAERLTFARAYRQNQQAAYQFMGLGWLHNHTYKLTLTGTSPTRLAEVNLPSGGAILLDEKTSGHFEAKPGSSAVMDYNATTSEYGLTGQDRSRYAFDATSLKLKSRTWASNEVWTYTYSGNNLAEVADNYGRKLQFTYVNNPGQFDDGKLWRVGDHTATGLTGATPTGRFIEFIYVTEKSDGAPIGSPPRALLADVRDTRGNTWSYDYYGQAVGETNSNLLSWMTERLSPSVDTTGDGTPDGAITLEQLTYEFWSQVDVAVNGGMELDRDWTGIVNALPTTNERSTTQVDTGSYSRHVVTSAANQGIEGVPTNWLAGRSYTVTARVYPVSGAVKMQVYGMAAYDQTSSGTGAWQTLTASHTPSTTSFERSLQFIASGAAAEFYVDSVTIIENIPNFSGISQARGIQGANPALEETVFYFQVNGNKTFEEMVGKRTIHYFDRGLYAGSEDPLRNRASQSPNDQFRAAVQTDPNGNHAWISWSADGKHLEKAADPLGNETSFAYNPDDTLSYRTDAQGRRITHLYDADLRQPTMVILAPSATELVTNGSMEADSDWTSVSTPPTNERASSQVDIGSHSRHVVAPSNAGIEGNTWDLIANQTYTITARVYPVSGTVKMQVTGETAFDKTTTLTGAWQTLSAVHTPASNSSGKKLQFIASGGSAEFYVDAVCITTRGELAVNGGMELDSDWTSVGSPTTNERSNVKADSGTYSRHLVANAGAQGIEGNLWNLVANQTYTIRARVYPVSGAVKMQVAGETAFDITTYETGAWQTLSAVYTPGADAANKRLQFVSLNGAAEFYVDTVTISLTRELAVNGDMEADSGWSSVGSPTTNARRPRVDTGSYFRRVVANALNQGIESATWDLTLDHSYLVIARVYVVRGAVKMQVTGETAFDKTTTLTGVWETLRVVHKATSSASGERLQVVAAALDSGTAEYYVDTVHIVDLGVVSGSIETVVRWQEFVYDTRGRTLEELILSPKDASVQQRTARAYHANGGGKGLLKRVDTFDVQQPTDSSFTEYTYDSFGRVVKTKQGSTLGDCCATLTDYDPAGNVLSSTRVNDLNAPNDALLNPVTAYGYDTVGRRIRTTVNSRTVSARTTLTFYDALDRVTRTITHYVNQSGGAAESPALWAWSAARSRWEKSASDTTPISHGMDSTQNVIGDTAYNARGLVRLQRDALGNVTLFGYDDAGRLIKTIQSANQPTYNNDYTGASPDPSLSSYSAVTTVDKDLVTSNQYDAAGNLVKTVDPLNVVAFTVYDALNRPIKTVRAAKDSATIALNPGDAGYNAANDPRSSGYTPSTDPDRDLIETTEYDVLGRVIRRQDTLGNWTLYGYDTLGRQVKVVQSAFNPTYDISGDPSLSSYSPNSAEDKDIITTNEYDTAGRLAKTIDALGVVSFTVYDGFSRPVKTVRAAKDSATIALNPGDAGYNAANDPRSASYAISVIPDRDLIETKEYDANGRVIRTKRLLENRPTEQWDTTLFGYDPLGRQIKVIRSASQPTYNIAADPDLSGYTPSSDSDKDLITQTAYDVRQRVMYTENELGSRTWFAYDSLGRQFKAIVNAVGTASDGGVNDPRSPSYTPSSDPDKDLITGTTYDLAGRLLTTQDAFNRVTRNGYDAVGRVVRTVTNYVDQGEDPKLWVWNNGWKKSDSTTPISHGTDNDQNIVASAVFDKGGRVLQSIDHRNNATLHVYDKVGQRLKTVANYLAQGMSDPANWVWDATDSRWEDGAGNAISFGTDKDQNRITTSTYDKGGRMTNTRDDAGIETRSVYDALGRRTQTTVNYVDGVFSGTAPDEDLISANTYNKGGQFVSSTDPRGTQTAFTYDKVGRRLTVTQAAGSPLASASYSCHDKAGRVLRSIQNWIDSGISPDAKTGSDWDFVPEHKGQYNDRNLITLHDYDLASRRVKITDPLGNFTSAAYFKDGQVKSITDPEDVVTQNRYDGVRRRTRVIQNWIDNGEDPSLWLWDDAVGQKRWEESDGTPIVHGTNNDQNIIVLVTYDKAGRLVSLRDPRGSQTTYAYDLRDRRKTLINPLSIAWTTAYSDQFASGSTRTTQTYPGVNGGPSYNVQRDFDRLGRPLSVAYGDPANTPDVKFSYDNVGNRTKMTEYSGAGFTNPIRETSYGYDDVRRLTGVGFDNDGGGTVDETVSYEYDAGGLRTKLTLPGSLNVVYSYDAKGQLVSLTDWDSQKTEFAHDLAGRLIATTRANGLRSRYHFDPGGRLRLLRHTAGYKTFAHFAFEVDKRGNRTQALECLARPTTTSDTTIAYNDKGLLLNGTWSEVSGFKESSDFGASLKIVFLGENRKDSMGVLGDKLMLTMGTGPDHSIYDLYVGGSLWQSFDGYATTTGQVDIKLEVHGDGPHLLEIRNRPEKNLASTGLKVRFKQLVILDKTFDLHTIEYAYDALSRLREARYNPNINTNVADADLLRRYQYVFDLAGNRTQEIVTIAGTPTTTNYTYNSANQLVSDGTNTLTYDNNGNMADDGTNIYTWDRANRLLSVGGASYKYDGLGRRVQQTVGADITKYLLDVQPGLSLVIGGNLNGNMTRYIHSPMGIHAQENASGVWTWAVPDGLGNVRLEADNALVVQAMRNTTPYLEQWGEQGTFAMPFAMTGELTDFNRGLVHLRARDYAMGLGVFPSLDPFEGTYDRPMSLNGYSWVQGKTVLCSDPQGQSPLCDLPPEVQEVQEILAGIRCEFPGANGATFNVADDSVTNIITVGAFVEGRFANVDGIALSVAAFINKLKTVNVAGQGTSITATLAGKYKTTAQKICPNGVTPGCADEYVNGLLNGDADIEPFPADLDVYAGGTPGLMRSAYVQTKLQLLATCGNQDLTSLYEKYRAGTGDVSSVALLRTIFVLGHPDMKEAYTFHMDWYDEMEDLRKCMRVAGYPSYDHRVVGERGNPEGGLMVTNLQGVLDIGAVCSAQFPKRECRLATDVPPPTPAPPPATPAPPPTRSCDYPICCRFSKPIRDAAGVPNCVRGGSPKCPGEL